MEVKAKTFVSENFYRVSLHNTDPDEIDLPSIAVDFTTKQNGDTKTVEWLVEEKYISLIEKTYKDKVSIELLTPGYRNYHYFGKNTMLNFCYASTYSQKWIATTFQQEKKEEESVFQKFRRQ